jgi:hypothetical protein
MYAFSQGCDTRLHAPYAMGLAALVALSLLTLAGAAPAQAAPPRECGSLGVSVHGDAVYATNITTRRVRCSSARGFIRRFLEKDVTFACQEGAFCTFRNYKCRLRSSGTHGRKRDYRCVRGNWVIRWQTAVRF